MFPRISYVRKSFRLTFVIRLILSRNRMKVYDKNGVRVNPRDIKWSKYKAGVPFTVKQDNKEGNSLGRIIFRFPNSFAVYLHDTPSRRTFARANRAVSHGCVRLEKALDFAFFLLKEPDELLEDRIRIAMDIAPKSDEGKKLTRSQAYRELKHYSLKDVCSCVSGLSDNVSGCRRAAQLL